MELTRAAGIPVTVQTVGEARSLPAAVELAAYRIVQESLTNVARHAGPATATVRLIHGSDGLDIEVCDDGGAQPPMGPSRGLVVGSLGCASVPGPSAAGCRLVPARVEGSL